ncbi:fimbrial protein [Burkholderia stagnalis]|uniref:fimbrial protein n=1 Tax=Burkholderia stagnalis TaxID=1503054 RepID=UPI0009C087C6|nr:fimbrial protein [Burkholderia stagnalis]
MKRFSRACLFAVFFLMANWARAAPCTITLQGGVSGLDPIVYTFPGFQVSDFDPNVPDGTVIYKADLPEYGTPGKLQCEYWINLISYRGVKTEIGLTGSGWLAGQLYSTGIAGIGMRFSLPVTEPYGYWPKSSTHGAYWAAINPNGIIRVELIKTGPITAGGVISGEVAEVLAGGYDFNDFKWVSIRVGGIITIEPKVPTCRVATPAITVPLGSMPASTFTGVGSVSPSKPFNIVLQCSGGETGTVANVYTTLTDHADPGNVSDTLSLASDATATGIGIQVLNGSTVIKYGPDSSAAGNTNQWKAGTTGNGTFTIPLTARYIQTAPKVTGGTADGLATFTMSYQ